MPSPCSSLNILLTRDKASSPNLAYLAIGQYPNVQPTLDTVGYVTLSYFYLYHCLYPYPSLLSSYLSSLHTMRQQLCYHYEMNGLGVLSCPYLNLFLLLLDGPATTTETRTSPSARLTPCKYTNRICICVHSCVCVCLTLASSSSLTVTLETNTLKYFKLTDAK